MSFFPENTVGFRLGGYKAGDITVVEPSTCDNIPQAMKDVTKVGVRLIQHRYQKRVTARPHRRRDALQRVM